jgi:hypothetical protein
VLEAVDGLTVWVVNPQTIRGMPGRKSDVHPDLPRMSLITLASLTFAPFQDLLDPVGFGGPFPDEALAIAHQLPQLSLRNG